MLAEIFHGDTDMKKCEEREKTKQDATIRYLFKWNTNLMQHCAGFISAESLYMFRAQAPIIRSI
jgi:hypothetical protein